MGQRYEIAEGNERKVERFILALYSAYVLAMICIILANDWNRGIISFMGAGMIISWAAYLGEYKDYRFRAMLASVIMQICAILYASQVEDVSASLYVFFAASVFSGLYGIKELVYLPVVSMVIAIFYHAVIVQTVHFEDMGDLFRGFLQFVNVFVVEYVIYVWIKKRNESSVKLVQAISDLKETEHSKDDFMANVSHEIRTPINTICGMSEIILREDHDENTKEKVMRMHTAGQNLLSVVSDMLDFSEIQSGKMELVEEVYDISSIIHDVINMAEIKKREKHIDLLVDCDATVPCGLLGDEKKIRRAIINILNNALKFTEDGYVNLIIGYRREAYGLNLSITVKDSGIGMKEESLEKIFSSYNQVDTKRNRQEGGIGLGLAISQAIVQKMGGVLTIKSRFGKGTAVKFVIPQKIVDERPLVKVENRETKKALFYIDMEQFEQPEIRDEYVTLINHVVTQLKIEACICRELAEAKRHIDREEFTHIFISITEYREAKEYIDALSNQTQVIVIAEYADCMKLTNTNLLHIAKPLSVLPIADALNGRLKNEERVVQRQKDSFIAPEVRALVVDDNAMNIDVIQGLLSKYQIHVSVACSGLEALDKIDAMNYDFVFMDHMMPEMDGVETMRRIRKKIGSYFQKVPIIAVTANAVAGTREMFIAEGFADFIEKPVEIPVLERVLKRTIPEKKLIFSVETEDDNKKAQAEKQKEKEALVVGDLDVKKGLLYCGGEEKYLTILKKFCGNGEANMAQIRELYDKADWKNYIIAVHAVKSSMFSIGALTLSEMAKQLEFAGKKENIEYIQQNHAAMLTEYERVLCILKEHLLIGGSMKEKEEDSEEDAKMPELSEEAFDARFSELEAAMFALDEARMKDILMQLAEYRYHGKSLKKKVDAVIGKVEMSDYMSAVEQVRTWKKMAGKEE